VTGAVGWFDASWAYAGLATATPAITVEASSEPFRVKLDIIFPSVRRFPSAKEKRPKPIPRLWQSGFSMKKESGAQFAVKAERQIVTDL
jgi:hypothetical protein